MRIGQFFCHPTAQDFSDTGPIRGGPIIVFPRTQVEITYAGQLPVIADPTVVMFYNAGQEYRRGQISPQGDRCEWFAFAPEIVREAIYEVDPQGAEHEASFRISHAPSDAGIYLQQRLIVEHILQDGNTDNLYVEEQMLIVLRAVVAQGYVRETRRPRGRRLETTQAYTTLVNEVKRMLALRYDEGLSLEEVAAALYVSPYHLCRLFQRETGRTLHAYLNQLRLRASLEPLAEAENGVTDIAVGLGYSSHSHFTSTFRQQFGLPPSTFRERVRKRGKREFSNFLIA